MAPPRPPVACAPCSARATRPAPPPGGRDASGRADVDGAEEQPRAVMHVLKYLQRRAMVPRPRCCCCCGSLSCRSRLAASPSLPVCARTDAVTECAAVERHRAGGHYRYRGACGAPSAPAPSGCGRSVSVGNEGGDGPARFEASVAGDDRARRIGEVSLFLFCFAFVCHVPTIGGIAPSFCACDHAVLR